MEKNIEQMSPERELFIFWQFNGDNSCYCQLKCPECYGRDIRTGKHYWNGDVYSWQAAFEKLDKQHGNTGIRFVFSYGEALLSKGFHECVEMIGNHPTWSLNIITNLLSDISKLMNTKLVKEGRLFINPCWHPEGVDDVTAAWELFKKNLLILKEHNVPTHVMMVWFDPTIKVFDRYFTWFDTNDFRVGVRRFVTSNVFPYGVIKKVFGDNISFAKDRFTLKKYSKGEERFIRAYTCPKVTKYGLDLKSPMGKPCYAGKDMMLVKCDGTVKLCASCEGGDKPTLGNVFDKDFKLLSSHTYCPTNNCGGDFGMLVLPDSEFGKLPSHLWKDTFISQVEDIKQDSPVPYKHRDEMKEAIALIEWERLMKCLK
jgi:hypothetical protein